MKHKQRAIITSINDLKKNFEVKITNCPTAREAGDNGYVLIPLPEDNLGDYFEVEDVIEFKSNAESGFKIINLSCQVLRFSKFKRDFISILRRLDNDNHPLKRCILSEPSCVLLSIKKNPEKVNATSEATPITENSL